MEAQPGRRGIRGRRLLWFGGLASMYKTKGLRVLTNDRLRYWHHAARAIIENDKVRLSDEVLEALLADNAKAGTFVRDNFKGIFFAKGV